MPEMISVGSTTISYIGYEPETENIKSRLIVIFKSGGRYTYEDVPADLWERFRTSPSKGRFFAEEIKHNYRFRRSEAGEVGQ